MTVKTTIGFLLNPDIALHDVYVRQQITSKGVLAENDGHISVCFANFNFDSNASRYVKRS